MQRLYSMFPHGGPGVGLLLLRICTAAMFALNVTHRVNFSSAVLQLLFVSLVGLVSGMLVIGLWTPVLAAVACATALANLVWAEQPWNVVYIFRILTAAALFFLGPGAYSVDAKLYGLRVTVLPPRRGDKSATT